MASLPWLTWNTDIYNKLQFTRKYSLLVKAKISARNNACTGTLGCKEGCINNVNHLMVMGIFLFFERIQELLKDIKIMKRHVPMDGIHVR